MGDEDDEAMRPFTGLPTELLLTIFGWLLPTELRESVAPVCRAWQRVCGAQDSLWGGWFRHFFPARFAPVKGAELFRSSARITTWLCGCGTRTNVLSPDVADECGGCGAPVSDEVAALRERHAERCEGERTLANDVRQMMAIVSSSAMVMIV